MKPLTEPKPGGRRRGGEPSRDFLEPIKSKPKTKKFIVYDIESKHDDTDVAGFTRPFMLGFFDPLAGRYEEYRNEPHLKDRLWHRRHTDPGGCIDKLMVTFLQKKYSGWVAYAHNAGSFDALFLLTWLTEHRDEYGFDLVLTQSSIQVIRVWRLPDDPEQEPSEKWEFLDSMKLLPMGLEKACKAMGVKGKLSHNLDMHEDDKRWSAYLEQDCRALASMMTRFYDLVEGTLHGEVGMTTPSTAMRLFRRCFLGHDGVQEKIPRYRHFPGCAAEESCGGCLHEWVRRGYYGGRTEIHHFYGEVLRYFDFNSSYAASMTRDMPIGDLIVEKGALDMRKHESQGGRYGGFCECTVQIPPECPIPPLPHRDVETGKLVFPTGQFHGVWSVDELALLSDPLVGGKVVHVVQTVWWGLRPMFQGMVKALWMLRDKTLPGYDEGLSLLGKLLVNGSYGKFAMKQERSTVVFRHYADETGGVKCFLCMQPLACDEDGEPVQGVCDACEGSKPAMPDAEGAVWYQAQRTDASYIIPQIAASITADARVRLWRSMRDVVTSDAGEVTTAGKLAFGDVVLRGGEAFVVVCADARAGVVELTLRGPDSTGKTSELSVVVVPKKAKVRLSGRVYYLDTDSVITNVLLPSSDVLGAMKDEYPGETLTYLGIQAKVYMITRTSKNTEEARARELLELARRDDAYDASTLGDMTNTKPKVTMKGFPPKLRTPENLDKLIAKETLAWERLEKVRTLARLGFERSPQMASVTKSFKSAYDKRVKFGDNATRAIVLHEPVGGVITDLDAAAE